MISELLITSSLKNELNALLESIFIFEGRIDFLKKRHEKGIDSSHDSLAKHREPHDIIDHFATNADPSKKKVYTQKIIDWYKNKDFRQEDHGRVRQTLKDFEANKKKLPHSDIGRYKSFHHLNSALADFKPKQTNMDWGEFSQDDIDHLNTKGSTVVHDEPKYTVRKVHDQRAMDILGKGSEWCVVSNKHRRTQLDGVGADSSYFSRYKKKGDIFHVHDKETGERFLSHHPTKQYKGADDKPRMQTLRKRYSAGLSKTLGGLRPNQVASSKFASKAQLHQLHDHPNKRVRREVAGNSNTAAHTLHAMHTDPDVKRAVAWNTSTHHKTLHAMHTDPDPDVKEGVANNTSTHHETLHAMRNDPDVKWRVASNTSTHHETLHAMHTDPDVKWAVAYNTSTHHKTLHAMHTDPDVKRHIAVGTRTHPDTLHAMSTDPDVKKAVARNTSTHHETLHAMHTDESNPDDVRKLARENLRNRARENLRNRGLL